MINKSIIKKIGKLWASENSINKIKKNLIESEFNIVIKQSKSFEYHVYGKDKKDYDILLDKIKYGLFRKDQE